jgi:hypothetical protein
MGGTRIASVVMALGVGMVAPAGAIDEFQVVVNAGAGANDCVSDSDNPPTLDTGLVPIGALPDSLSATRTASAAIGIASGDAEGYGQVELTAPGSFAGVVMHARASSLAVAPEDPGPPPCATSASTFANSRVFYRETLHPSGLAPGTPFTLQVTVQLDGPMAGGTAGSFPSSTHAQLTFGDPGIPGDPIAQLACPEVNGVCAQMDTGQFEVIAGSPHEVNLELFTQVSALANNGLPASTSAATDFDAVTPPRRARLCIDIVTPGTSYTTDSGGDLRCTPGPPVAPALPPIALAAIAAGLLGFAALALRRG